MSLSRRILFAQMFVAGIVGMLLRRQDARADTLTYSYDAQGRVTRVTSSNGSTVDYTYDAAGNRTQVVRAGGSPPSPPPPPPPTFTQTIAVTGAIPVNLRALADAAGYNGAQNATITFEVNNGVTIAGAFGVRNAAPAAGGAGGVGIDTGTWPTASYTIALTLLVKTGGKVYGGGGAGGIGASFGPGAGYGGAGGGAGGDAIYCRLPISITVQSGGEIKSGGGGGGGGGGWSLDAGGDITIYAGGGGGGGFPNGQGGNLGDSAVSAPPGTSAGGGAGGAGGGGAPAGYTTGGGGAGGNAATAGANGVNGADGGDFNFTRLQRGLGAGPGFAIRKNGHTVTVTNNGTITGTVG